MTKTIRTRVLWTVQVVLALLFLFAGVMKLILPIEAMTQQMPLPGLFLRFIGVAEVLGAIGLIVPRLLRRWPALVPLAAAGLTLIMIGAAVLTLASGQVAPALFPLAVSLFAAFVAYGRLPRKQQKITLRPGDIAYPCATEECSTEQ